MKVILICNIPNLGKIGDIASVKDGYARNFLLPQKKVIFYTKEAYEVFKKEKKIFEENNLKNIEIANQVKDKIHNKDIIIVGNASDDGRLYGSVSSSVIASEIANDNVFRSNIILKKPIKDIGIYKVDIELHSEVKTYIRLIVARTKSEAAVMIKEESSNVKKGKDKNENLD